MTIKELKLLIKEEVKSLKEYNPKDHGIDETKLNSVQDKLNFDYQVGTRVTFGIPVRGGMDGSFGEILKVNRKTLVVKETNKGLGEILLDKKLVYSVILFDKQT